MNELMGGDGIKIWNMNVEVCSELITSQLAVETGQMNKSNYRLVIETSCIQYIYVFVRGSKLKIWRNVSILKNTLAYSQM